MEFSYGLYEISTILILKFEKKIQVAIIDLLPWWLRRKRIHLQCGRPEFDPWFGKIPWRRAWQLTPVFLPGESPWAEEGGGLQSMDCKPVDMTEQLCTAQL